MNPRKPELSGRLSAFTLPHMTKNPLPFDSQRTLNSISVLAQANPNSSQLVVRDSNCLSVARNSCSLGLLAIHFCTLICNICCAKSLHCKYKFCAIALSCYFVIALLHCCVIMRYCVIALLSYCVIGTVKYPFKEPVPPPHSRLGFPITIALLAMMCKDAKQLLHFAHQCFVQYSHF